MWLVIQSLPPSSHSPESPCANTSVEGPQSLAQGPGYTAHFLFQFSCRHNRRQVHSPELGHICKGPASREGHSPRYRGSGLRHIFRGDMTAHTGGTRICNKPGGLLLPGLAGPLGWVSQFRGGEAPEPKGKGSSLGQGCDGREEQEQAHPEHSPLHQRGTGQRMLALPEPGRCRRGDPLCCSQPGPHGLTLWSGQARVGERRAERTLPPG